MTDKESQRQRQNKSSISLKWRFVAVGLIVYVALFLIIMHAVGKYSGVLWGTTMMDIPPEVINEIQARSRMLVAAIFAVVLPVWLLGSIIFSSQLAARFRDLVETASSIEDKNAPAVQEIASFEPSNSSDEIDQVKDMLSSMMDQVRRSDELFRSIVSNQRELIFRWRSDISFTFVNQAFCEFFNRPEEHWLISDPEFLTQGLRSTYPELARAVFDEVLETVSPTNPEVLNETYLTMPDGETHWVQWRTLAWFNDEGDIIECQSIGYVLTDLKRVQLELENANQQLARLSQELIGSQETERANLARFLHDEVLGELGEIVRQPRDQAANITMIQEIIDLLRSQIYVMRSPMLEYGLSMALEDLVDTMQEMVGKDSDVVFQYEVPPSAVRYNPEVETHIYRIVQQASKNALDHSGGNLIRINGIIREGYIDLGIEDNGNGFELQSLDTRMLAVQRHYGIIGMEERCKIIGARLVIDTAPGEGTRVRVRWQDGDTVRIRVEPEGARLLYESHKKYEI